MGTRTQIMDAALDRFAARGYDSVGVQEICTRAGVTKPTLYHYFSNKRGLIDAVLSASVDGLQTRLEPALAYDGDMPATLERVIEAFLSFAEEQPRSMRLLLSLQYAAEQSEARAAVRPYYDQLLEQLKALFGEAADDHGNMRGREEPYAVSFLGTVFTYIFLLLEGRISRDESLAFRVMHQFSHGIYS
ncbi:MAG: TetR family transcriptional regulator [Spirochaetes bacterium]|jgi:TetR/AcrR family transcriptional regulator|nr:TetR family transcriptional regulator [Spirochaetota bacterium]